MTHDLDHDKIEMYQTNKVNCVRIDLSDKSLLQAEPEVIKALVLDEARSKTLIFWKDLPGMTLPETDASPGSQKSGASTLSIWDIIIAIAVLFGIKYVWGKIRRLLSGKRHSR